MWLPKRSTAEVNIWLTVRGVSAARPESPILSFTSASPCDVHRPGSAAAAGNAREFGRWAFTGRHGKKERRKKKKKVLNEVPLFLRNVQEILQLKNKLDTSFWWTDYKNRETVSTRIFGISVLNFFLLFTLHVPTPIYLEKMLKLDNLPVEL